ncbi:MAG TPA: phage major capsid protein [Acidimicrobiales bacterium]|nr:phage major capsid protein [Acidimicrobiales bacterium]
MRLSEQQRARAAAIKEQLEQLTAGVQARGDQNMTPEETAQFDQLLAERKDALKRAAELEEMETAEDRAAEVRKEAGETGEQRTAPVEVNEPDIYTKDGRNSYFRDLYMSAKHQDASAADRLRRHGAHAAETRAVGNTNGAGGSGGEWAPPTWVMDEWINLIRPGRVTADLFRHEDVPFGTSSLNYPKLLTGTAVGLQSTQNSALASTDPTTGFIQVGFSTIGGKNVMSQQILDQARNFDGVILSDLAAAYSQQVGTQVFTGTGTGSGTNAVINGLGAATIGTTQTWTQASPTAAGFYGQAAALLATFLAKRLMPPTHWVMAPRRWYWLAASVDSANRPLVVPNGNAYNPIATQSNPAVPMGVVGTLLGVPVVIDPLVPVNLGAGTNQDIVYLLKADDLVLLESGPQTEVFRETYADSLGVLVRLYAYVASVLNRHSESIGVLTGTGLVTPTFGS